MTDATRTVRELMRAPGAKLDDLFGRSPADRIPAGDSVGAFLIAPGSPVAPAAARLVRLIAWKGKIFDPGTGTCRNKVGPLGTRALMARVYYGPSRFDAHRAIILDYSRTSRLAWWIRDEMREVAPGVFLGFAYWGKHRILKFVLDSTPGK